MFTLAQLCPCKFPRLLLRMPFRLRLRGLLWRLRRCLHFQTRPAMSSGASKIVNPSIARNFYGSQPMVTSYYPASRFNPAGKTIRVLQPQLAMLTFRVLHLPL